MKIFLICFFISLINAQKAPELAEGVNLISKFLISNKFQKIKETSNDLVQVDSIYAYSLNIYSGDHSKALLAATFALVPGQSIPLVKGFISIPIPGNDKSIVSKKLENLPRYLFYDSPKTKFGDRDKLAHFFGSAFLSYNVGFFNFSEFIGIFIELIQSACNLEGGMDRRDLLANRLGCKFGRRISPKKNIFPSQIFLDYNKKILSSNK